MLTSPYRYGGIFELGSREYTLDDFYSLQLDKLDRYVCLKESGVVLPKEGEALDSSSDEDEDDEDGSDDNTEVGSDDGESTLFGKDAEDDDALVRAKMEAIEEGEEPEVVQMLKEEVQRLGLEDEVTATELVELEAVRVRVTGYYSLHFRTSPLDPGPPSSSDGFHGGVSRRKSLGRRSHHHSVTRRDARDVFRSIK
jgi:hypothetical protein